MKKILKLRKQWKNKNKISMRISLILFQGLVKPQGKFLSVFVLLCILVCSFAIFSLSLSSLVLNGFSSLIQEAIHSIHPSITINKYSTEQFIGKATFDVPLQKSINNILKENSSISGYQVFIRDQVYLTIHYNDLSISKRIFILGAGDAQGEETIPIASGQIGKLNFYNDGDGLSPVIISKNLIPMAKVGDKMNIETIQGNLDVKIIGFTNESLLRIDFVILPIKSTADLLKKESLPDNYFISLKNHSDSFQESKKISQLFKNSLSTKLIVSSRDSIFEYIIDIINGFKFIVYLIISSLMIMASIFLYCIFDIIIKRKLKEIATLFAIGISYKSVYISFLLVGIFIVVFSSIIGISFSTLFSKIILYFISIDLLKSFGINEFNLVISYLDHFYFIVSLMIFSLFSITISIRKTLKTHIVEAMKS